MSQRKSIPVPVKCMLWGRAAGRCQFLGCNRPLSRHSKTKKSVNLAEAAHIVGLSKDGPRGEECLSTELAKDISNLMLLCHECHETVDADGREFPVILLHKMKADHERRIATVTAIDAARQSHVLLYGANVGEHSSPVSYETAASAMLPDWYPADTSPISLGMVNSSFTDTSADFWSIESAHLRSMVAQQIRPRLASGSIRHMSVFAFAPQPLLMLLGFLLSDIQSAEVYQLHREPPDWRWREEPVSFDYVVQEPVDFKGAPALVLSLSATVADDRVSAVLGGDATIWRVTVNDPHNDFLRSRRQVRQFRETMRGLLDRIKARHGANAVLHVFPAMPVAIAVEMGRVVMPKADLPLRVYDENRSLGGFIHALDIDGGCCAEGGVR